MKPYDPNLDDPNAQDTTQSAVQTSTVAPGQTGAIGSQDAPSGTGANNQKSSGRWTNLNAYLDANRDSNLGDNLVGKVQGEVDQAKATQSQAGTEFAGRVSQATPQFNADLVNRATTDAANFVKNADDVSAFKKKRDAEYKGPNNFFDAPDLASRAAGATRSASAKADNLKSEGGRWQLLDNYFGKQGYNAGQKSLDSLVATSANPGQFTSAAGRAGASADEAEASLGQMAENLSAQAAEGRGATETVRNQTRAALGIDRSGNRLKSGALGATQDQIERQFADAVTKRDQDFLTVTNELGDRGIRSATLQRLGAPSGIGNELYGVDPRRFLSKVDTTAGNFASPEQRATLRALEQLADLESAYDFTADRPESLLRLDSEALGAKVSEARSAYQSRSKQLADQVSRLGQQRQELQNFLNAPGSKPIDFSPTRLNAQIADLDKQIAALGEQQKALDAEFELPEVTPASNGFQTMPRGGR